MLVSCNCKVLKLYSAPRSNKSRKGHYTNLREGEGGRFGILSITNPNYEESNPHCDVTIEEASLVKMAYANDENFVDRSEFISTSPTEIVCGDLSSALPVKALHGGPIPAPL